MQHLQFKGTYVFKQNGIEVGRSSNLITTNGRKMILEYLSKSRTDWSVDMAIGALSTTPTAADTQLNYETGRYPVTLKSFMSANTITGDPDLIVVRSVIPASIYANIYEIGTYAVSAGNSGSSGKNNFIITDFTDLTAWSVTSGNGVTVVSFTAQLSSSPRIGGNSVSISTSTVYTASNISIPLGNYNQLDTLDILMYNSVGGVMTVKLTDISGITQTLSYTLPTNSGYFSISTLFDSSLSLNSGSPISDFTYLTGIQITTDSTASVTIDAIKTSSAAEISVEESLVSKSVLGTPIGKLYNVPLDVEYYIELL